MSFDRDALAAAIATHGAVWRVVVAAVEGSAPREVGAAMLVWTGGADGTIGGGALEHEAAARAHGSVDRLERIALGPARGQCCGGAVTLLTERWDADRLAAAGDPVVRAPGGGDMPLAVARVLDRARAAGAAAAPGLVQGWMVEPVSRPLRHVWIYGAGHVGRALAGVLAPLPGLAVTWADTAAARFPNDLPAGVVPLVAADPAAAVARAPDNAEHLVLTYSHALDLAICHAILSRPFGAAGLIGSATKRARFRSRLAALGHLPEPIARIDCPIGDPSLGKHPQAIAVGVAASMLVRGAPAAVREAAPAAQAAP